MKPSAAQSHVSDGLYDLHLIYMMYLLGKVDIINKLQVLCRCGEVDKEHDGALGTLPLYSYRGVHFFA
jgi:hypothetical protein